MVIILIAWTASARAQIPVDDLRIQLGGIPLELGMSQQDVLRRLAVVYDVKHQDNLAGTWTVTRKGERPYQLIGNVSFREDKLVVVSKQWGSPLDDQTAKGLATALAQAVESITGRGRACTVSMDSQVFGSMLGSRTVIQCGRHRLNVVAPQDPTWAASVVEYLQ